MPRYDVVTFVAKLNRMPRYIIERNLPGVGDYSDAQMQSFARQNCDILESLGPHIQWVESFVAENKLYCIYMASDKGVLMHHAALWDIPANRIEEIKTVIGPVTAEAVANV